MENLNFQIPKIVTVSDLAIIDEMLLSKEVYDKMAERAFSLLDMHKLFDAKSRKHIRFQINPLALLSDRRRRRLDLKPECIFGVHLNTYRFNRFQVLAFKYAFMESLFLELRAYKKAGE